MIYKKKNNNYKSAEEDWLQPPETILKTQGPIKEK